MARKLRVEYPGAIYHLMNRGDRRESIFKDDEDRQRFLGTLGEACVKTGWQVHAKEKVSVNGIATFLLEAQDAAWLASYEWNIRARFITS